MMGDAFGSFSIDELDRDGDELLLVELGRMGRALVIAGLLPIMIVRTVAS